MPQGENNKSVVKRNDYESTNKPLGKNYLLVIGIDEYAHCPRLYNAVKDAQDIVKILVERFQFESATIIKLLLKPIFTKPLNILQIRSHQKIIFYSIFQVMENSKSFSI